MTTFDLAEVRGFAADIDTRMDQCDDNGEGIGCATRDDSLRYYAARCREYYDGVRGWGAEVFAGRMAFDAEVERIWREAGECLRERAAEKLAAGRIAVLPCYDLPGLVALQTALDELGKLLDGWVTPKLSVGPAAREKTRPTPEALAEAQRRIAALPPFPTNWGPAEKYRPFRQ